MPEFMFIGPVWVKCPSLNQSLWLGFQKSHMSAPGVRQWLPRAVPPAKEASGELSVVGTGGGLLAFGGCLPRILNVLQFLGQPCKVKNGLPPKIPVVLP